MGLSPYKRLLRDFGDVLDASLKTRVAWRREEAEIRLTRLKQEVLLDQARANRGELLLR